MFNLIYAELNQEVHGLSLTATASDLMNVSERTVRNWQTKNEQDSAKLLQIEEKLKKGIIDYLVSKQNLTLLEAEQYYQAIPSVKSGGLNTGMFASDMVYFATGGDEKNYKHSADIAYKIDEYSNRFIEIKKLKDIQLTKIFFNEIYDWICLFYSEIDCEALQKLKLSLNEIRYLEDCQGFLKEASVFMFYYQFTTLDLELGADYFGKLNAYPLFTLVMPGLAPDIKLNQNVNKFLRNGKQAQSGIYHKSTLRFLDFIYTLVYWYNNRKPPKALPKVKDMEKLFGVSSSTIISWRDETTKFNQRSLNSIWKIIKRPTDQGALLPPPLLMLYAMLLYKRLVKYGENGKLISIQETEDEYKDFWLLNKNKLEAKGLTFGKDAWPEYLLYSVKF